MPNPLPQNMKKEVDGATRIIESFLKQKFVPEAVYQKCRGIAVLSVMKVGFTFSVRAGSGIVVGYNKRDGWGAPAAIEMAGGGWGLQIGAQLTDIMMILNTEAAVKAFCSGNVTLGAGISAAAGPVGKAAEGDVALKNPAAVYTYSNSKGLFAGMSLEGAGIVIRDSENKKFYGEKISAQDIVLGKVETPYAHFPNFYKALGKLKANVNVGSTTTTSTFGPAPPSLYRSNSNSDTTTTPTTLLTTPTTNRPRSGSTGKAVPPRPPAFFKVRVLYAFNPECRSDLPLSVGDIVVVEEATGEWWYGTNKTTGRVGDFPSNYVERIE
eukprot:comp19246_c0_seq1/m.22028 comp19246_c0_seq1/g.22028  ORF comp19246_c0_seq1/g.22028 comp19246_c0_seq1/m.22028 type:complete len:324 (-) comp19246_c0_seq1:424-1395(-)